MQLSLKNTMHASSFRSKLFASLKRFLRACPVQCQYLIPTVLNLWQCHSPTFLRLLPGQWITFIYFPIHGLKPSITRNFPSKLHAEKLFPKSCFTIDLNQMKWYILSSIFTKFEYEGLNGPGGVGCAAGWGHIFTTGLTIMGSHFQ